MDCGLVIQSGYLLLPALLSPFSRNWGVFGGFFDAAEGNFSGFILCLLE